MSTKASSILARIDERGRVLPRVRLRDFAAVEEQLQKVDLHATGRYEILGQIAEGGIGQVLKGRDADLGRDVAMKVLREDRMGNVELLRRFVEEAQIGGQLQHPGVVPVYELGLHDGRRPYFAMKLVKGRTLAALLEDRKGPAESRRDFLSIYLQMCQTMAYAHSRNVIHRDLKPANVMVGAFGEVQVVDWGFAKVLTEGGVADERRASRAASDLTRIATLRTTGEGSESIAGSVMGTPAYMPPEQALGNTEELDSRSDVFSLGAILCEILTGAPVYRGEPGELLLMAAQCRTDDALARLDKSGADPDLVELAKACLAQLRKDRPRDALVLAKRVSVHLSSAEERIQRSRLATIEARKATAETAARAAKAKAKIEAARVESEKRAAQLERMRRRADEARAEAEEAGRSRRQMLVLGVAVLVALCVAGGSYAWIRKGRLAEADRVAERVHKSLEEARLHKGEGQWQAALDAADRARAEAQDSVRGEADALVAAIVTDRDAQSERDASLARDRAFVERLEEIRLGAFDGPAALRADRAYDEAFAGQGIDLGNPADAARRIRAIDGWRAVARALDDRLWLRGSWVERRGLDRKQLVAVLKVLDPDPWRDRLRAARFEGLEHVHSLVAELGKQKTRPAETVVIAGDALAAKGDVGAAIRLLQGEYRDHVDDPWLSHHLATFLDEQGRTTEALRYRVAVLARYPRSVRAKTVLARELRRDGSLPQALDFARDAVHDHDNSPEAHLELAIALLASGNKSEADDAYRKATSLAPGRGWVHDEWGLAAGDLGDSKRRLEAWREALRVEPGLTHVHTEIGAELASARDLDAAIAEFRQSVTLDPEDYSGWLGLGVVLAAANRADESLEVTNKAVELRPDDWSAHASLGYALRRTNQAEASLEEFRKSAELAPGQALPQVNLGDALLLAGEVQKAVKAYFAAIKIDNTDVTLTSLGFGLRYAGEIGQAEICAREALALNSEYIEAQVLLGVLFLDRGLLDQGIAELEKALRIDPKYPDALLVLGHANLHRGDPRRALELYQEAFEARPNWAAALSGIGRARERQGYIAGAREAWERAAGRTGPGEDSYSAADAGWRLARLVMRKGKFADALPVLREADRVGKSAGVWYYPTATWLEACGKMASLEPQLSALREGKYVPKTADEKATFAVMCSLLGDDEVAVRLFAEAFAEDEDLAYVTSENRLHAARSASRLAQASNDAQVRRRALDWLKAEVEDRAKGLWDIYPRTRLWSRTVLLDLSVDTDFSGWRESSRLASLPEEERGEWRALWAGIQVALERSER